MSKTASSIVEKARQYVGWTPEGGVNHKELIDTYNTLNPLPRKVKATASLGWCAIFVTALGKMLGMEDIIYPEMGADKMAQLYRAAGQEISMKKNALAGDIIFYDWDGAGYVDHVGLVESVSYDASVPVLTVIEGNKSNNVGTRTIKTNDKRIKYICRPNYEDEDIPATEDDVEIVADADIDRLATCLEECLEILKKYRVNRIS